MNQNRNPINITALLFGVGVIALIGVIVLAAISTDSLGSLIGGIAVIGGIFVALALIVVLLIHAASTPIERISTAQLNFQAERNRHIEAVIKQGLLPISRKIEYKPLALPEPEYDIPVSTDGVVASQIDDYLADAIELGALSAQWHNSNRTPDRRQLAPYRVAKKDEYFWGEAGYARWQRAMNYYIFKKLAEQRHEGKRPLGTFVAQRFDTAEQVYRALPRADTRAGG